MTQQNQTFMLADTFPAKAYLLITHLNDVDPEVSSFSSDGASFEIYDQSIFAQKYLPQYFKHSNYGSFVRQLNLYGFTSSRLKRNNDVVVWTHEFFRRDRKDLVQEIKRTKTKTKTKPKKVKSSVKPSQVHHISNPSCPSPLFLSDDLSSQNTHTSATGSTRDSGIDQGWLESEFASLKHQNKFLEQKLDTLLALTVRISSVSLEEIQVGEKRRRMMSSPTESEDNREYAHPGQLGSINEQQNSPDGDNYACESKSYDEGDRKSPPEAVVADPLRENGIIYSASGGKGVSYVSSNVTAEHELEMKDDSFKRFVDIMLNEEEEEEEECKMMEALEAHEMESHGSATSRAMAPANMNNHENNSIASSPPEPACSTEDALDDELVEEAMNAILPDGATIDADGDLFALSDSIDRLQSNDYQTETFRANQAADKIEGPHPIHAISSEVPTLQVGDIGDVEEGNLPVGVAVIDAQVELIDSNVDTQDRQHRQRHRRRVTCLLAFISAVLVVGVTWPAVAKKKKNNEVKKAHHGPNGKGGNSWGQGGKPSGEGGGWKDDKAEDTLDGFGVIEPGKLENITQDEEGYDDDQPEISKETTQVYKSFSDTIHRRRRKRMKSLFDDEGGGIFNSFSLTLDGTGFFCSKQG